LADIEMPVVRLLEIEEGFGRHPHAGRSTTASKRHPPRACVSRGADHAVDCLVLHRRQCLSKRRRYRNDSELLEWFDLDRGAPPCVRICHRLLLEPDREGEFFASLKIVMTLTVILPAAPGADRSGGS
jgi:hypothetical protein